MFTLLNLQVSAFWDFAFLVLPAGKLAVFLSFFLSVLKHTPFQVFFFFNICLFLFGCIRSSLKHVGSPLRRVDPSLW